MSNDKITCNKCGSDQISANKKGFSGKKAVAGAVLTGGVGLLAGTIGSNKIVITCLNCGNQFRPGSNAATTTNTKEYSKGTYVFARVAMFVIGILFTFVAIGLAVAHSWGGFSFCAIAAFLCIAMGIAYGKKIKAMV